jgi:calcineurin-like phosphoesterase family protein
MRYFTSDTHYGHANIIKFCDRPYADVHHMNVDLVNRAAAMLSPDDALWHLGDVALGYLDSSLTNLARIPAAVTLVAGNHDRCHPYNNKRGERFVEVYRERCQLRDLVLANTRLTLANGVEVQMSHFPFAETEAVATSRTASRFRCRTSRSLRPKRWRPRDRTSLRSGDRSMTGGGCCAGTSTRSGANAAEPSTSAWTPGAAPR